MPTKTLITQAQAEQIAKGAANRVRRSAAIAFVILFAGGIVGFTINQNDNESSRQAVVDSGSAVAVVSCNRDFDSTRELRKIITEGRDQIQLYVAEGTLTQAQADRQIDQSNKALGRLPLPDCRKADDELTSDPDEDISAPTPKHQ